MKFTVLLILTGKPMQMKTGLVKTRGQYFQLSRFFFFFSLSFSHPLSPQTHFDGSII
jgi:hypothetical protein